MASSLPDSCDEATVFDFTAFGVHKSVGVAHGQSALGASYDCASAEYFSLESSDALSPCDFSAHVHSAAAGRKQEALIVPGTASTHEIETTAQCPSSSGVRPPDYDYAAHCCCGCDDGDCFALPLAPSHLRLTVRAGAGAGADCGALAVNIVTSYLREHSSSISTSGPCGLLPSSRGGWVCSSVGHGPAVVSFALQLYRDSSATAAADADADCATFIVEWQRRRGCAMAFGGLFDAFHRSLEEKCGGLEHVTMSSRSRSARKPAPRGERKRCFSPPPAPPIGTHSAVADSRAVEVLQRWAEGDAVEAISAASAMLRHLTASNAAALRVLLAEVSMSALEAAVDEADCADVPASAPEGVNDLRIDVRGSAVRIRGGTVLSALQSLASIVQDPAVQPRLRQSRAVYALARCSRVGCSVARALSADVLGALSPCLSAQSQAASGCSMTSELHQHGDCNVSPNCTRESASAPSHAVAPTKISRAKSEQARSMAPLLGDVMVAAAAPAKLTLARHHSSPTGKVKNALTRRGSRNSGDEVATDDGISPTCPHDFFVFNA